MQALTKKIFGSNFGFRVVQSTGLAKGFGFLFSFVFYIFIVECLPLAWRFVKWSWGHFTALLAWFREIINRAVQKWAKYLFKGAILFIGGIVGTELGQYIFNNNEWILDAVNHFIFTIILDILHYYIVDHIPWEMLPNVTLPNVTQWIA